MPPEPTPEDGHVLRWYACYTRARSEKKVAGRLTAKGLATYVPLIPRERQWADRRKIVQWPAFPSYVFCRFGDADYRDIIVTPGIASIVTHDGRPAAIPDEEIENVRRFVEGVAESGLEPEPAPEFHEGQPVRVTRGPFRGVEGFVREVRGRRRLLVGIRRIGHLLEVDIPVDALEPRSPAP
ncbi:MAG: UpxY family transcription antiterminator [Gemmatimonadota bacterium]